jgi:predicted transcriptional regulator
LAVSKGLNPYERVVLDILRNSRRPLSTRELAAFGNMSWLTAKKTVERLYRNRGDIHTEKRGNAQLWFLR